MRNPRRRSISTKVTDAEYLAIVRLAAPLTVSEWTRKVLVNAVHPDPFHFMMLAEFVSLRTIVVNLMVHLARHGAIRDEELNGLVRWVDDQMVRDTHERIQQYQSRLERQGVKQAGR